MAWYGLMISKDIEEEFESNLMFSEYIASFFNSEAVTKIRSARDSKKDKRFMDDSEFENMIKNKEFLKTDYIPNNITNKENNIADRRSARDTRLPKEMSGILKINRDNF